MFDPFRDFATAGYLRNFAGEKDLRIVKRVEHELFRANLPDAVAFLATLSSIAYVDFLEVHRILFQGLYPWAGQDRRVVAPECAISKGETLFSHPASARLAVEEGLRLGLDKKRMSEAPGLVMGLFAYGHPFLDGNGRTMLIVHAELCHRADFSIDWHRTRKTEYLRALSDEIASPGQRILDDYLLRHVSPRQDRSIWTQVAPSLQGLDGLPSLDRVDGDFGDEAIAKKYEQFDRERKKGYQSGAA